ncbi:calcium/proton exchanger [Colletotrichum navitas]|uniref:Vacuolar calcium ion transporter n=1 Tax=Colletotrichum navitas TaxID=681940 RepID=A0AAD8V7Q8_9PEZI|nr:calcium/proton exchanger [Colletotrichum navitas]KAK1595488.1 calcium/proton exchanger [Colletotrichum navitas]
MSPPSIPPYRQAYRQLTGSRWGDSEHAFMVLEDTRTSYSARSELPLHNRTPPRATSRRNRVRIRPSGESGRSGFHPLKFLKITWISSSRASRFCNILWPVVPAAFIVRYILPQSHVLIFVLTYLAMIPCANMVGFAGQELSRKLNHVFGVLAETTLGSVVEVILFMVLLQDNQFTVIKAAILGSILATMLLCLGMCFVAGGIRRDEAEFSETVSEAGTGLLFTAGVALAVPAVFSYSMAASLTVKQLEDKTLHISRVVSILLVIAYGVFVCFQSHTHHGIYDAIFENDEQREHKSSKHVDKPKLTLTECIIGLVISIAPVTFMAIYLVEQIHPIVTKHGVVSDHLMGLILVPLVEKAAEHLTAVNEAWDNRMNFALSHVLGATLQTALLNGPLIVIIAWALDKQMDIVFEAFDITMLILAMLTVGNFLRDQKCNYLEGFLCIIAYLAIAAAAYNYPNPEGVGED